MIVREEGAGERPAVLDINRRAFGGGEEATLIEALSRDGDVTLSLVAEQEGRLVGHILFSPLALTVDGRAVKALALAPMAVLPDMQAKGIGSTLVREALKLAAAGGIEAVIVLGHLGFYPRFGFSHGSVAHIDSPYAQHEEFMGVELAPGALAGRAGTCRYARAFAALS